MLSRIRVRIIIIVQKKENNKYGSENLRQGSSLDEGNKSKLILKNECTRVLNIFIWLRNILILDIL